MIFTVRVGAAISRPPTPSNIRFSFVTVEAETELEAELFAAQIVASRNEVPRINHGEWEPNQPLVVMPTSTKVLH